jgi:ATP-dependent Clp protease ATP-binding subunit ClpA
VLLVLLSLLLQGPVLKERVIGQDDAVDSIVAALCRARVGLKDPHRPAAAMLLVGPTGVGKTELTKVLAEQYFGTQVRGVKLLFAAMFGWVVIVYVAASEVV